MAIDNCKFSINDIDASILQHFNWRKIVSNQGYVYYHYNLKSWRCSRENKNFKLRLTLKHQRNKSGYKLTVENSLRKWYFNKNSYKRDFYLSEVFDCLDKISIALNIPLDKLLKAKISKIEFGLTIPLKPVYKKMLTGLYFMKRMPRENYEDSIYFGKINSSYRVIFYDKYKESLKRSKNNYDKNILSTKIMFLRYEIKIQYLSKCPFFKNNSSNFYDLIDNFENILCYLINLAKKIEYVDWMSINIDTPITCNSQYEGLMHYRDIQHTGLHRILLEVSQSHTKNKAHLRKKIVDVIKQNSQGNYRRLKVNFISKLERKKGIVLRH